MDKVKEEREQVLRSPPAWLHGISEPRFEEAMLYRHVRAGDEDDENAGGKIVLERCEDVAVGDSEEVVMGDGDTDEGIFPVSVDASVSGGEDYAEPYRFRVTRFPGERQPSIRALGIVHHLLINDDTKEPNPVLFAPENAPQRPQSLGGVLEALRLLLTRPPALPDAALLGASDIEAEKRRSRFEEQWRQYAAHNRERERVIRTWRELSKSPSLVSSTPELDRAWLSDELNAVMDSLSSHASASADALAETVRRRLVAELAPGVYSFPLFSTQFCNLIIEESEEYAKSGLPQPRPNSMNNYGLVVNAIGMEALIHVLQVRVLQPIASALFPIEGASFDGHHSFLVRYKAGEDRGLDMHTDDSDVTFNVCLGKAFTGAGLTVCGMSGSDTLRQFSLSYPHRIGHCIVHRGRHRHGADDIETGERINLIVWNHSSLWRQTDDYRRIRFLDEAAAPDPRCMSFTHDRDFSEFADASHVEHVKAKGLLKKGWYPPVGVTVPRRRLG